MKWRAIRRSSWIMLKKGPGQIAGAVGGNLRDRSAKAIARGGDNHYGGWVVMAAITVTDFTLCLS